MSAPSYRQYNYQPERSNSTHSSNSSRMSDSTRTPGDVSGAVRHLLLATKDLQDLLTRWSLGQATDVQVSDAYVRVGTDFNLAVTAFAHHNIELSDMHSIPAELRVVLERCLAQEPSSEALARHMPGIRTVIYRLLQGLQRRQGAWEAQRRRATGGAGA